MNTRHFILAGLCAYLNVLCFFSCSDDKKEISMICGTIFKPEDEQSIVLAGKYITDTTNVICTYQWFTYIPRYIYLEGQNGERFCVSYDPYSKHTYYKYCINFYNTLYVPGDTFTFNAKLYEYKIDTAIMKHQIYKMHHHYLLDLPEGVPMYTVRTEEIDLWYIGGGNRKKIEF